jgi:hypothetical protein
MKMIKGTSMTLRLIPPLGFTLVAEIGFLAADALKFDSSAAGF